MKIINKFLNHLEMMLSDKNKIEKVIIAAAGIILIQRSKEDHWSLIWEFPRGKCDKPIDEEPSKCVVREIKEETGLDVVVEEFLGTYEYLAEGGKRKTICYNYLCSMKDENQKVVLKKNPESGILEHDSYKWITQAGEAELLVHPDQKKFIQQVLSTDNSIISVPDNSFTKNNQVEEKY